ncbi:hypothetical protein [Halomonas sp. 141]|uniref:hypothetical protein n=1 Tax=Halomonas sp. 141 TaxID=2056666 RepID=UPI0012FDB6E4|nr:hypothetical protein [Halomonas sp. 141]
MPSRVDEQNPLSYPTSADWHQLFMRLLPWLGCLALAGALLFFVAYHWVVMARLSELWLLWWGLVNMAIWLYASVWGLWGALGWLQVAGLWGLAVVNSVALAGWEWGVQRRGWSAGWALRVLALGSGVPVTLLMMHWLSGALTHAFLPVAVYGAWLALLLLGYALGQWLVLGAGVVLWLVALGRYYYWLDLSLLAKSGLLLLLGITVLGALLLTGLYDEALQRLGGLAP